MGLTQTTSEQERTLYYLGGEPYNKNNFGKIDKLRDRKINKILNGEENK
jgi:hypothetical protein